LGIVSVITENQAPEGLVPSLLVENVNINITVAQSHPEKIFALPLLVWFIKIDAQK
jgi:hypothetical protein